jgi:hypothetical protein
LSRSSSKSIPCQTGIGDSFLHITDLQFALSRRDFLRECFQLACDCGLLSRARRAESRLDACSFLPDCFDLVGDRPASNWYRHDVHDLLRCSTARRDRRILSLCADHFCPMIVPVREPSRAVAAASRQDERKAKGERGVSLIGRGAEPCPPQRRVGERVVGGDDETKSIHQVCRTWYPATMQLFKPDPVLTSVPGGSRVEGEVGPPGSCQEQLSTLPGLAPNQKEHGGYRRLASVRWAGGSQGGAASAVESGPVQGSSTLTMLGGSSTSGSFVQEMLTRHPSIRQLASERRRRLAGRNAQTGGHGPRVPAGGVP